MKNSSAQRRTAFPRVAYRIPILVLGFASLLAGVFAGLVRLGLDLPSPTPGLVQLHGPLMVAGFFGVVIGLERAVALGRPIAYLSPILTGFGGILILLGAPLPVAQIAFALGAFLFLYSTLSVLKIQFASHLVVLTSGALALFVGNSLWLFGATFETVLPWWVAFLVLTIVGERLELTRLRPINKTAKTVFFTIIAGNVAATLALSMGYGPAPWYFGLSLAGMAGWLIVFDIARITVRQQGLVRYIAVCLLSGYGWLAFGGLIWALSGTQLLGAYAYDAALHSIFLGFVFAMVFGHAPIIFPAVSTLSVPYHRAFYLHLAVLEVSLIARVVADLLELDLLRIFSGIGNGLTLALFIANTILAVRRGLRDNRERALKDSATPTLARP